MGTAAKTVRIDHPKSDGPTKPPRERRHHFAAFGVATNVTQVFGRLRHEGTKKPYSGNTLLSPTKETGFWIIHFKRDDFPHAATDTYTLEVYDADAISDGPLATVEHISFLDSKKLPFGDVVITYPQPSDPVCTEFSAYGTAPASLDVTGSFSTCSGQALEASPGPDWVLHCMCSGGSCTLTVSQTGAGDGVVDFTTAPC